MKAWAIASEGTNPQRRATVTVLAINQYLTLEIYKTRAEARRVVSYIKRDCIKKYAMKIVRIEIKVIPKRGI
jgi:hypothetical protein